MEVDEQRLMIDQLREEKPRILDEKDTKIAELHADFIQADRNATKLENDIRNMQVRGQGLKRSRWKCGSEGLRWLHGWLG